MNKIIDFSIENILNNQPRKNKKVYLVIKRKRKGGGLNDNQEANTMPYKRFSDTLKYLTKLNPYNTEKKNVEVAIKNTNGTFIDKLFTTTKKAEPKTEEIKTAETSKAETSEEESKMEETPKTEASEEEEEENKIRIVETEGELLEYTREYYEEKRKGKKEEESSVGFF